MILMFYNQLAPCQTTGKEAYYIDVLDPWLLTYAKAQATRPKAYEKKESLSVILQLALIEACEYMHKLNVLQHWSDPRGH